VPALLVQSNDELEAVAFEIAKDEIVFG